MNCIILLLLLGCCGGWGDNGCGCSAPGRGCGDAGKGCHAGRRPERKGPDRMGRPGPCGCEEEKPCCEERERECDCECDRSGAGDCGGPGMIPPPWQDYPKFPRRDGEDCCEQ